MFGNSVSHSGWFWKSPEINLNFTKTLRQSIFDGPHRTQAIDSLDSTLIVNFVESAPVESRTPYFPLINVLSSVRPDGWLQVVYTNNNCSEKRIFLDGASDGPVCPFYSRDYEFYCGPFLVYQLFNRPFSSWCAHTWAVVIDPAYPGMIRPIGGVSWGYSLPWWSLRPKMILPKSLGQTQWADDWTWLEPFFSEDVVEKIKRQDGIKRASSLPILVLPASGTCR